MVADNRIACPDCDLLVAVPHLQPGERAVCRRCEAVLSVSRADMLPRTASLSMAALVMLGIAMSFSFLTISSNGVTNSMTLLQTVSYLAEYGADAIAVLVLIFVILVPMAMLLLMLTLAAALQLGTFPSWMAAPTRWLFHLNGWSMVEVFSIGVIVALVKLAAMARVELGLSFFAYLAFSALFLAAFSSFDRLTVWETIERLRTVRGAV